jgi:hypothetical protein
MASSHDGSIAYFRFGDDDLPGIPLTKHEMTQSLHKSYGDYIGINNHEKEQILISSAGIELEEEMKQMGGIRGTTTTSTSLAATTISIPKAPTPTPQQVQQRQREVKTSTGRRKITPIAVDT